jgi:hypothetical protein
MTQPKDYANKIAERLARNVSKTAERRVNLTEDQLLLMLAQAAREGYAMAYGVKP